MNRSMSRRAAPGQFRKALLGALHGEIAPHQLDRRVDVADRGHSPRSLDLAN